MHKAEKLVSRQIQDNDFFPIKGGNHIDDLKSSLVR
jgi:hypothetical protein